MKTIRLLIAASLALAALSGTVLALEWWQPSTARAEDALNAPTAPQTLPPPYLSDDDVADAPYHSRSPTVDGRIDPGEYAGAGKVAFPGYGGDVEVFFKQDGSNLYVAFDFPALGSSVSGGNYADVYLDTGNDGGGLDGNDYWLRVCDDGTTQEYTATTGSWTRVTTPVSWTAAAMTSLTGGIWQAEFAIEYSKLGLIAGAFKELGLAVGATDGGVYLWPAGANGSTPATWGSLVSSSGDASIVPSGWDSFYWKPGPWEDYAPSGMPDFDQKQDAWWAIGLTGPVSTHCGPVATANSLWWFDSKFETLTGTMPPVISDTYRLVQSYGPGAWDDHDPQNVGGMGTPGLVDDLANNYFNTNDVQGGGAWLGTFVTDMHSGTLAYLRDHGLWDDYHVTLVISPSFAWVADEVMRSEDVILLLGFYEEQPPGSGNWARVGGHYVNVAGVDPMQGQIAFSDPFVDNAEAGGAGRVLSGTLILPHTPGHPSYVHNDAGNVSHDIYPMIPTSSPGGDWGPDGYPWWHFEPWFFAGVINPHPFIPTEPYSGTAFVQVEVEFALTVSPYTWKASGEWLPDEDPVWGDWQPWQDYAPSGIPDFAQKQDNWRNPPDPSGKWTFCGPVAAANSLWWFDSKFEPNSITSTVPGLDDNYPLVQSYDPTGIWDDHDPRNVDDPNTPWPGPGILPPPVLPGQGEFVEDLAAWFQTDMIGSGTVITDLYTGIEQYITYKNLRQGYVITQVKSPDFWWVAEEVEVSEDVILLLGFWQEQPPGSENWVRLGGHYVTLPGVDKQGGFVAFSDPWFDRIGQTWPYAGIGTASGWPSYLGRVADGWLIPHQPIPGHPPEIHNDAGNVSHDVYYVTATDSPGGVWGPWDYVTEWGYDVENFWGQNGQMEPPPVTDDPIQTEVEWAVAVSPVADVWITKTVTPTTVMPGDWVTFTITFANRGNDAENVVISDVLPSGLINTSYTYTLDYAGTLVGHDTYTWTVGALRWDEGGTITVTAQLDPGLSWPAETVITNTVEITTTTQEQYQLDQYANTAQATFNIGEYGYLEGYVYDYETEGVNPPCMTATVSIEPGGLTVTADSGTGYYGPVMLISETYTVAASASGYSTETAIVDVVTGMTTTQYFSLSRSVIEVTPTDFISITAYANQEVTYSLTITNAGHAPLGFEIQELPSDLSWAWEDPISGTIPGPGEVGIDVTFLCTETRDYTGALRITHDDPCETTPITVPIVLHCSEQPPPEWWKQVNGQPWAAGFLVTVETSDTIEIVDVISSSQPFTLTETWNPGRLNLTTYSPSAGIVVTGAGWLTWTASGGGVVTLTKEFYVEPCTWIQTVLEETLYAGGALVGQRPITIAKTAPGLWINSVYSAEVTAGEPATFTLEYGNLGGYENDVAITNTFPISAPFVSSVPSPAAKAPDGAWATWEVGDLAMAAEKSIEVIVAISDTLPHSTTVEIWDGIYNHAGELADKVTTTFHVSKTVCISITGVNFGRSPANPQAGEVVTFTITSILPLNATPPFTYQWGFGDGGAATGDPVTHTYAVSDTYWATVTATNPCGGPVWMSHSVNVTGEPAITVAPLSLNATLDPGETTAVTLTIGNASTATASLNWSLAENPDRSWLDELPKNGIVTPSSSDDVVVTFDAAFLSHGVYTTTIEVTSDDPGEPQIDVSAVMTVNCIPVTGVNIVVTNTGAIYTGTVVHFSANITPDDAAKPYSYTVVYGDGISVTASSNADPLTTPLDHAFAATGTHTVEIAVWNCSMSASQAVTDPVVVTVSEQPAICVGVNITDVIDDSPVDLGNAMHFTAIVTGDTPITYTWDFDSDGIPEQGGVGLNTTSYTYTTAGAYTVTLDVENGCPSSDTYSFQVTVNPLTCEEVTGVDLSLVTVGAIYTDTDVQFSANVTPDDAAKPYTYRLTIDGAPGGVMTSNDDPLVFTDTFAATGAHTVEIAVWNCDMTVPETATVTFTVYEQGVCVRLTEIIIHGETSGAPGVYTFTTSYEPADASLPIAYVWKNGDTTATSTCILDVGDHDLWVMATNCTTTKVLDTHTIIIRRYIYLPLVVRNYP